MSNTSLRLGAVLLACILGAACGKDERPPPDVKVEDRDEGFEPDVGGDASDEADADLSDVDQPDAPDAPDPSDCAGVECGPGQACIDEVCKVVNSCEGALDAGVLQAGATLELTGSLLTDGVEDIEATCAATSLRDRVVTFEVETAMVVDIAVRWIGQFDGVIELRSDCADVDSVIFCSDNENRVIALEAGVYHLVLDQKFGNAGTFEVKLSGEEAACLEDMCVGDKILRCQDPTNPQELQCGDGCNDARCDGATCDNPIEIAASGVFTYSGDADAHGRNYNFGSNTACIPEELSSPALTLGAELVFWLPDLEVGNVIVVDTSPPADNNVNAVFITKQCGETAACSAASMADVVEWTVDEAGGYYVIIDKTGATATAFHYSIEVR